MPLVKKIMENGQKARQTDDITDRTIPFRDYLRSQSLPGAASDVDMILWGRTNKRLVPRVILELTRTDSTEAIGRAYLKAIEDRYFSRDRQGFLTATIARKLGCRAYIVLFHATCQFFWVYDLLNYPNAWVHYTKEEMDNFLLTMTADFTYSNDEEV